MKIIEKERDEGARLLIIPNWIQRGMQNTLGINVPHWDIKDRTISNYYD